MDAGTHDQTPDPGQRPHPAGSGGRELRPWVPDAAVGIGIIALSWFLTAGLWASPTTRVPGDNRPDQALTEWFLAVGARFWVGDISLVTDTMNAPEGINLMVNASSLLPGIVFAPVTWLFGAPVTFALLVCGNLAATGFGWYLLCARALRLHRAAALLAGVFCGFAPGMLAQSLGHIHITAQWLVPPIVYCVLRLWRGLTPLRTGLALGLLVTAQVFIGEEVLLLTALTLALLTLFGLVFGLAFDRTRTLAALRPLATGTGVALAVALGLLAYPLWVQFAGPRHVVGGAFPPEQYTADLASYAGYSSRVLAGRGHNADYLAAGQAELNTYFGWPLLLLLAGCVIYMWRYTYTKAFLPTALILSYLSLGPEVAFNGRRTGIGGIYLLLHTIPPFDDALPTRFALALIPLFGIMLALTLHRILHEKLTLDRLLGQGRDRSGPIPALLVLGFATALIPLLPMPLPTTDRPPVPAYFTDGRWRDCVSPGGVLVPVPPANPHHTEPLRWAAAAHIGFAIPEGFAIGPFDMGGQASVFPQTRPTSRLLEEVRVTGAPGTVTQKQRQQARQDLRYWGASCVVLGPDPNQQALKTTLEELLGPGQDNAGVWVWRPTG